MKPLPGKVRKNAKYTREDIIAGTKHEMEHTRDRREARRIAIQHLNEHYTYYRVMPMAEQVMNIRENQPPIKRKRKRRVRPAGPSMPNFGFNLGFG